MTDIRKIIRWVVNIGSLVVAVAALPELGAVVPVTALPAIAAVAAIVNTVLSVIRQIGAGEGFVTRKPF